jgi:hypothetical protein
MPRHPYGAGHGQLRVLPYDHGEVRDLLGEPQALTHEVIVSNPQMVASSEYVIWFQCGFILRLKTLTGAFSELHLVCLMYVAFRQNASERDIGFDLSKEYDTASALQLSRD